jgi:hypothetical protein
VVDILEVGKKDDSKLTPNVFEQAFGRSMGACERCGRSLHGRYHIHHKDMNSYNNELSNLLVLCPNCHYEVEGPQLEEILSFYQ